MRFSSPCGGVVFFFSSRRRHTISDRDWSSDVCSSDLYASLVAAELVTDRATSSVAGTVFFTREARFVRIDGFPIEALPQGWMLVFANLDVPGVIGRIGTLCGGHGINIAGMQLRREARRRRAGFVPNPG